MYRFEESSSSFIEDWILPLVWYDIGSFTEVMNMSMLHLRKLSNLLSEKMIVERYKNIKGFNMGDKG